MTGTEKLQAIVEVLLETVQEADPQGVSSNLLYNAVIGYLSFDQYTQVMSALEMTGKVKRLGHVYYPVTVVDRVLAASWASQASE